VPQNRPSNVASNCLPHPGGKEVTEIPGNDWFSVISGVETAKAANLAAFRIKYGAPEIMNGTRQTINVPVASVLSNIR
jgi:hypothetical protein